MHCCASHLIILTQTLTPTATFTLLHVAGEQQSVDTPDREKIDYPADTSRSNLAASLALVRGGGPTLALTRGLL